MTRRSIAFFLLLATMIPSKNCEDEMTEDSNLLSTLFHYDENQLAIRNLVTNDATKLQQFREAARKFVSHGYSIGYEDGYANNIVEFFECAVDNQKILMEVYEEPKTKAIWAGKNKNLSDDEADKVKFPVDLEHIITENDEWIPICDAQLFGNDNGSDDDDDDDDDEDSVVESEYLGTLPFPMTEKSFIKTRTTGLPFSSKAAKKKLLLDIKKSAANWFLILTCKKKCPGFVVRLQKLLRQIKVDNPYIYKNLYDIYWRFAIHTARSYKIMRTAHDKLIKNFREYLDRNGKEEVTFEQLLFSYAPSWFITTEQILFLNVMKDARDPNHKEPLKYYPAVNKNGKQTYIIYDDSRKCPRDRLLRRSTVKLPSIHYRTLIFKNRQKPLAT